MTSINPRGRLVRMKPRPDGTAIISFRGEAAQEAARLSSQGMKPSEIIELLKEVYGEPVPDDGGDG